jgi:putative endonuclease
MIAPLATAIQGAPSGPGVYVLMGSDGSLYKGACRDLQERLRDHQAGRASRTRRLRPLLLVHIERTRTYEEALRKERYLKTGHGRQGLKRRLDGITPLVSGRGQTVPPVARAAREGGPALPPSAGLAGNLPADAFEGSNPSPTTTSRRKALSSGHEP